MASARVSTCTLAKILERGFRKSLDGKMLPGATKYGDNEYSIEEKAIKQDFYIESFVQRSRLHR